MLLPPCSCEEMGLGKTVEALALILVRVELVDFCCSVVCLSRSVYFRPSDRHLMLRVAQRLWLVFFILASQVSHFACLMPFPSNSPRSCRQRCWINGRRRWLSAWNSVCCRPTFTLPIIRRHSVRTSMWSELSSSRHANSRRPLMN